MCYTLPEVYRLPVRTYAAIALNAPYRWRSSSHKANLIPQSKRQDTTIIVIPCLCSFTVPSSPSAEPPINKKRTRTLFRKELGSSTNCMVVLFYGLFCPSAVAVSVLGRVLSLRHCRAAAHGALAPLGLPGAGLDGPALAFAVSAASAGDLWRTFGCGSFFIKSLTEPGNCGTLFVVRKY